MDLLLYAINKASPKSNNVMPAMIANFFHPTAPSNGIVVMKSSGVNVGNMIKAIITMPTTIHKRVLPFINTMMIF